MKSKYKKTSFYFLFLIGILAPIFSVGSAYHESNQVLENLKSVHENKQRTALSLEISHFDSKNFNWIIKAKESNSNRKLDLINAKKISVIRKNQLGQKDLEIEGPVALISANTKKVNFTEKTLIRIPQEKIEAIAEKMEISDQEPIKADNGFQLFFSSDKKSSINSKAALIDLDFRHILFRKVKESTILRDKKNDNETKIKAKELEIWFKERKNQLGENKKIDKIELREEAQLVQEDFLLNAKKIKVFFNPSAKTQKPSRIEALGNVKVATENYTCNSNYLRVFYENGNPIRAIFTGKPIAEKGQTKILGEKMVYSFQEKKVKIFGDVKTL